MQKIALFFVRGDYSSRARGRGRVRAHV